MNELGHGRLWLVGGPVCHTSAPGCLIAMTSVVRCQRGVLVHKGVCR
mgnify:CR=1 FL=1